jgi:hypothetical protein
MRIGLTQRLPVHEHDLSCQHLVPSTAQAVHCHTSGSTHWSAPRREQAPVSLRNC